MKNPNKNFDGKADVGLQVFWYPGGVKEPGTVPRIGVIANSWSRGVVDLLVLPLQSGTVEYVDGVYHASSPSTRDPITSGPSSAAKRKGMWEFSPTSVAYLESLENDSLSPALARKAK